MRKILITGASGFIARQIITELLKNHYEVVACARDTSLIIATFPAITTIKCDFLTDTNHLIWIKNLIDIEVVINCVGVFHTLNEKDMWLIHYETPKILFEACEKIGVKKIIQISALGIDKNQLPYSLSKLKIENYLQTCKIDSTILRPSLVYGEGSYGGSSLFRGFAGLPFILPLPGKAQQKFQPIHIEDLARIVIECITLPGKKIFPVVGPETVNLKTILNSLRSWLGFKKARNISIPLWLIRIIAKVGDFFKNSPINSTGFYMMQSDNIAETSDLHQLTQATSFLPRGFNQGLFEHPSQVQDRWHARLYFIKPLLRFSIAFVWIWTAFVSLFLYPHEQSYLLLSEAKIPPPWQALLLYGSSIIDGLLGILVLLNYRLKLIGSLQIIIITFYTIILSFFFSELWLHPFAPLAKNIPLFFATLIMISLESDR